ncbi:unnamed protein product [Cuscuta europaea]|uniref:DUF4005 domain-containing protein n=1 Tax=Cuscuta europaea TaxID=41803 RepID=A0A9P0ZVV0_CUSEU|nr:unnamed protein product [Cuscuta europaea]
MGRKSSWLSALKKALSSETKKKDKVVHKSKWFGKEKRADLESHVTIPPTDQVKLMEAKNEQNKHAYSVAIATAAAAEAAVAAAQAAAEVVRLTAAARYLGKSKEEIAAIKIQTAFRGYMARRALRGLKGLVRLKTMLHGQCVKRQVASTLKCVQTIARVQSEVRSRRLKMWEEEEHALQRQLQQKRHENDIEKLRVLQCSEYWNVSTQSKEQIEANMQNKHDATKRRERALAYAYTHQKLRNSPRSMNQTIMDPNNPHWGWSLFERWMAARPQESKSSSCTELTDASTPLHRPNKEHRSRHGLQWPSTPTTKSKRMRPQSPRTSYADDDWRSMGSAQSERCPRYSIAGSSSMRDDISLTSLPAIPGYMTLTESAKARSRFPSHLSYSEKGTLIGSVSKRLSFSGSSGGLRRHSVPSKADISFGNYLKVVS